MTISMQGQSRRPGRRAALLIAASAVALAPIAASAQQQDQQPQQPVRRTIQNWTFDLRTTYTDNYRRLPEELPRTVVLPQPVLTPLGPVFPQVLGRDSLEVEPPDNVVFTAGLRGGGVYERPGITAVATGGVTVSAYADNEAIDDRLLDTLTQPLTPGIVPPFIPGGTPLDVSFGFREDEEVFIQPDLSASASARIVEDLVYVDASAIAVQQAVSRLADLEAESAGQLGDRTTYIGGSLSPYVSREVFGQGTIEGRYRFSGVAVAAEEFLSNDRFVDPDAMDDRFANDSLSHEVIAEYQSGALLDRIEFSVRASAQRSEETGSDVLPEVTLERLSGVLGVAYDVNRSLALTGRFGYDEVDVEQVSSDGTVFAADEALSDEFSGVNWSTGFVYTPSQRTRFGLSVGERFGGALIDADVSLQPTPRLTLSAQAGRELGTGVQGTFAAFQALNSQTLNLVQTLGQVQGESNRRLLDRAVGLRGGFRAALPQQGGLSARNRVSGNASYTTARSTLNASVSWDETEFASQGGLDERTNTTISLNLAAQRQVSRRVTLTARGRILYTDGVFIEEVVLDPEGGAADRSTTQSFASLDAAYQIGPRLSATAQVYRSQRDTGEVSLAGTALDYEENAASVGIRWTF